MMDMPRRRPSRTGSTMPLASKLSITSKRTDFSLLWSCGLRTGLTARHLRAAPSGFQVVGSLLLPGIAHLDTVVYCERASIFRQTRRRALVLHHFRLAFQGRDAALYMNRKVIHCDLRGREFCPDDGFQAGVAQAGLPFGLG